MSMKKEKRYRNEWKYCENTIVLETIKQRLKSILIYTSHEYLVDKSSGVLIYAHQSFSKDTNILRCYYMV